jgi:hypothetical protein
MYVYVCVYIYIYTHTAVMSLPHVLYTHAGIQTRIFTQMLHSLRLLAHAPLLYDHSVYVYRYTHVCIHTRMYTQMIQSLRLLAHAHLAVCVYTLTHVCIHTRMYTQMIYSLRLMAHAPLLYDHSVYVHAHTCMYRHTYVYANDLLTSFDGPCTLAV